MLKRYAYPCRYVDLSFVRSVPVLCTIANQMTDVIYNQFGDLLLDLDQPWLAPAWLQRFAIAVHAKGAALDN